MGEGEFPAISIVTPSFNQAQFLEETIQSVQAQGYPKFEHIVIDGGSIDDSLLIIRRYEDKIAYWVSEKDRGQTDAINKGFARSTGEIIAWLNSDDMYCDGALNKVGQYFAQHPDCMWVAGNVLFTDEDGHVLSRKRPFYSPFILRHGSASLYQPSVFVRRKVIEVSGLPLAAFHTIMDREWYCRIAAHYSPHLIDEDLALFRWHPESKSSSAKTTPYYRRYLEERVIVSGEKSRFLRLMIKVARRPSLCLLEQIARVLKIAQRGRRLLSRKGSRLQ